jgi:hypothetical protein
MRIILIGQIAIIAIGTIAIFALVLWHHPHHIGLASVIASVVLVNMAVAARIVYRKGKRRVVEAVKAAADRQV